MNSNTFLPNIVILVSKTEWICPSHLRKSAIGDDQVDQTNKIRVVNEI